MARDHARFKPSFWTDSSANDEGRFLATATAIGGNRSA